MFYSDNSVEVDESGHNHLDTDDCDEGCDCLEDDEMDYPDIPGYLDAPSYMGTYTN